MASFDVTGSSGQLNLSDSVWDAAALDTSADFTGIFDKIKSNVGKGAYTSAIEKSTVDPIGPSFEQSSGVVGDTSRGTSDIANLFRQTVVPGLIMAINSSYETSTDSVTGMSKSDALVGVAAVQAGNLQVLTPAPDRFVTSNRVVFSSVNEQSQTKTLTLNNTGSGPLQVTLDIVNSQENVAKRAADDNRAADFNLVNTPTSFTIASGGSRNVSVRFNPLRNAFNSGDGITDTVNGENYASLNISLGDQSQKTVHLAGLNTANYEGNNEPALAEIARTIFGQGVNIGKEAQILGGSKAPNGLLGDEVYSPYWLKADTTKPVLLYPLAVYSGRTTTPHDSVRFEAKPGSGGNSGSIYQLPGGDDISGGENQKLLPKILGSGGGSITPTASTVDFNPTKAFALYRGQASTDDSKNGTEGLHNWRIFPVENAQGNQIANTWLAAVDPGAVEGQGGKNYDYQDDVYLLVNAKPESSQPSGGQLPYRIDTGSNSSYTDTSGKTWFSDKFFTPSTSEAESYTAPIANTSDDKLYQTYRGKASTINYNFPINQPGRVNIYLRFAEMYWGVPGRGNGGVGSRIFDVTAEGNTVLNNFDIYQAAGGSLKAIERAINGVQVNDGTLNLQFKASKDFPAISAISVLRTGG